MTEKKEIDFSKKFKSLMGEDSVYEFFLKMENLMPKYAKKKMRTIFLLLFSLWNIWQNIKKNLQYHPYLFNQFNYM